MRLVLLALLAAAVGWGASLSGVVKDPGGAAVQEAAVTIESAGVSTSAATDSQGRFTFPDLPAGDYRLSVTHAGFEPYSRTVTASFSSAPLSIALVIAMVKTTVQVGGRSALRNSDPNYQALRSATLRRVYRVHDLALTRDAATFTFRSGSFSFLPPVLGHVTAGVFVGDGAFRLQPAFEIAAAHLQQISGSPAVDEEFNSLVVYFTDSTFDEIAAHSELVDESPKAHQDALHRLQEELRDRNDLPGTYLQRMLAADDIPNFEAEMVAEIYNRTGGSFHAFIHGRKHSGLRFVLNPLGALPQLPAPEEVALLNFDPSNNNDGIWYLSHTVAELRARNASSAEEKRLAAPEHYRIETDLSRSLRLTVNCELRFHPLRGGVRAIPFDLLPDMQVSRLMLDGREVPFVQESRKKDGSFYLVLPEALEMGRSYTAVVEYEGGDLIRDLGGKLLTILPMQPWYPKPRGVSRATYDLTFRAPRGMSLIATGEPVRSAVEGGQEVTQWTSKTPITAAAFNYGALSRRERIDESSGFAIEAWLGERSDKAFFIPDSALGLDRAENAVRVFQHWFGEPPYRRLAVTESRFLSSLPGLVFAPTITLTDASSRYQSVARVIGGRSLPVIPGRGTIVSAQVFDESLPLQVSGQWWGTLVGPASFHEDWLMRGMADFSSSVYDMADESKGKDFREHWRAARDLLLAKTYWGIRRASAAPLWLGAMAEPFLVQRGITTYRNPFVSPSTLLTGMKGGFVIHMLRRLMYDNATGDQDFIALMHDLTTAFRFQNVTTEAFQWMVEKHMKPEMDLEGNHRMDWFFREWVYGAELPSYSLEYSVSKGENGKPLLHGKLTQSGVSGDFRMRVPIYVRFGARTVSVGALNLAGNQTREFRAPLPEDPKKVLLNFNYDVLSLESDARQVH